MNLLVPKIRRAKGFWLASVFMLGCSFYAGASAVKGLYVGNDFYPPSDSVQSAARTSGFTRLFLSFLYVDGHGNITYNDTVIVRDGAYVGDVRWRSKLAALKAAPTSVERIELVIGGPSKAGEDTIVNLKNLISTEGTSPASVLYRNFLALQEATGADAIQLADDRNQDAATIVAVGQLAAELGIKVSLRPTSNPEFWARIATQLGAKSDAIYLKCYGEGSANEPEVWSRVLKGCHLYPGLWGNTDTTTSAMSKMRTWRTTAHISGAFMWLNGFLPNDAGKWSGALAYGLDPVASVRLVNKSSGKSLRLVGEGMTNGSAISQAANQIENNQRWLLIPAGEGDHFKIISWVSGLAASITYDSCMVGAPLWTWDYNNDPSQQFDLVNAGNGWFEIKNVRSGMVLEVAGGSTTDNAAIQQNLSNGAASQLWKLYPFEASSLAAEDFDYPVGPLSGQSGGEGWDGNWLDVLNVGNEVRAGNLLGGTNVPVGYDSRSAGNSAFIPNDKRVGRYLDCSANGNFGAYGYLDSNGRIGADGKTLYLSFLEQPTKTSLFYEFELDRGTERIAGVGNDIHGDDVNLRAPASSFNRIGSGNTNVNFYVVRIDFQAGNDDVRVYRNPVSDTEPDQPDLTVPDVADLSFNRISLAAFANENTVRFDQIRLGSTWQSVIAAGAEFEPRPLNSIGQEDLFRQVRVSAQVLGGSQDEYYLLDGDAGLRVLLTRNAQFEPGDVVIVTGLVKRRGAFVDLIEAQARKVGRMALPPARVLNVANPTHGTFWVATEGVLTGFKERGIEKGLELRIGTQRCLAWFQPPAKTPVTWAIGSRLRLTGIYLPKPTEKVPGGESEPAFELLLNSPRAVVVIAQPPWWTLRRAMIAMGILGAGLASAFVWIRLLQRQVNRQTVRLRSEITQRELAERERAIEEERSRISRDLHDDLGSILTQINMLANYSSAMRLPPDMMQERIRQISDKSHRMITALDEVVWMMSSKNESLSSFVAYIAAYTEEFLARTNIVCRIEAPAIYPEKAVAAEVRNNVFSSVKEAITNAVRHGDPKRVLVKLNVVPEGFEISIRDDGRGFDLANVKKGNGIANLQVRMQKVGGTCHIQSSVVDGTTVILQLPLVPST